MKKKNKKQLILIFGLLIKPNTSKSFLGLTYGIGPHTQWARFQALTISISLLKQQLEIVFHGRIVHISHVQIHLQNCIQEKKSLSKEHQEGSESTMKFALFCRITQLFLEEK